MNQAVHTKGGFMTESILLNISQWKDNLKAYPWSKFFTKLFLLTSMFCFTNIYSVSAGTVRIKMATTTSTENTGLFYELLPPFEKLFNVKVDVIAVGTGKALKLGENGDVDMVLVHAKQSEEEFVDKGYGVNRRDVMYNDFILVGPEDDPADIEGKNAVESLKTIAENEVTFASRGDDSGTHKKEKTLWKEAGFTPKGQWYLETGQGMGATLQLADEKEAYTLVDRGTFIAYEDKVSLAILCEGDERLFNPYGIIAVNPARHPHSKYIYAMALIGWVTSPQGQKIIRDFNKDGKVLFHPNAYK